MADKQISQLNQHTSPSGSDLLVIVNNNETKKITYADLKDSITINSDNEILNAFTESFNSFSASVHTEILAGTNEQDLSNLVTNVTLGILSGSVDSRLDNLEANTGSYLTTLNGSISESSQLTASYDERYVLSGSITQTTWDNIENKPSGLVSSSIQIEGFETTGRGILSGSISYDSLTNIPSGIISESTDLSSLNAFTSSYFTDSSSFDNKILTQESRIDAILSASTSDADTFSEIVNLINSVDTTNDNAFASFYTSSTIRISSLENATSSYETKGREIVSSSQQIIDLGFVTTSSFNIVSESLDTRIDILEAYSSSHLVPTSSYSFRTSQMDVYVKNTTGTQIDKGKVVRIIGATGDNPLIVTASFLTEGQSANTLGITIENIPNDSFGWVITEGILLGVDTTGMNAGQLLYLDSNGSFTTTPPIAPNHGVRLGEVLREQQNNGSIYVRIDNGSELGESHDVVDTSTITSYGDILMKSGSVWINNSTFSSSIDSTIKSLENATSSYETKGSGIISGSSQLTSSFDTRYVLSGSLVSGGGASVTTSDTAPSSPTTGDLWWKSNDGNLYVYYDGYWVIATDTISGLPIGVISGSSQLTSSFDSRYTQTGSFNTLSSSVDNRLDILETSIITGSSNYTQVLGNRRTSITTIGVSIISGSITTSGNPVQIMVTGDANPVNATSWARLQIYRNENPIGNIIQVENSSNLNVPYCLNVIDTPSAGTYSYSMRTVSGIAGLFDFGEATGPLLTAVELNTNTNITSKNNTFTGNNTFNGSVTIGPGAGDEGGELALAYSPNTTLTGNAVSVDVYQNKVRIFEGGGSSRGVSIDLSKAPNSVGGELIWKTSGMVAAGTFVSLDNLKCTVTTSGSRGLSVGAVSTNFEADISGWYGLNGGGNGMASNNITYTTTASTSLFGWNFPGHGDTAQYQIRDKTNNRFYRITMMIGVSYISNFISIERLF